MWLVVTFILTSVYTVRSQTLITYTLEEETTSVVPLGNIIQDGGLQLPQDTSVSFTILPVDGNLHQLFQVEQNGDFVRSARLDRDAVCPQAEACEIRLDIQVNNPPDFFEIVKVVVEVTDINDEFPSFSENVYNIQVSEAAILDSTVSLPRAIDLDSPQNGAVTYRAANLDITKFQLVTGSGDEPVLLVKDSLDRENTAEYEFILLAADSQATDNSASATVSIDLLDINDNVPEFTKDLYEVSTYEMVAANESLVQVSASDRDAGENGRVFYYLSPVTIETYGAVFRVDEESGDVRTNGQLDYESIKEALLTVIARNREPTSPSSQARVSVRVTDINDESPSIKVNKEPLGGVFTIPENASLRTFVAHITVSDPDTGEGGTFTCSLVDNNSFDLVKLHDTDYKVVTNQLYDRETEAEYKASVTCIDKGEPVRSSTQDINIQLTDINDNHPVCRQDLFTAQVAENQMTEDSIVTVVATDEDINENGRLSYTIDSGPASLSAREHLAVNPQTGEIFVIVPLNYEEMKTLSFNINVSDHGNHSFTSDCKVIIKVNDTDDEYPLFDEVIYEMQMAEQNEPGALVGEVKANDWDSDEFNSFTYSFDDNIEDSSTNVSMTEGFNIDPITGKITVNYTFDRESRASYSLKVLAEGNGPNYLKSSCTVEITITDINDNSPVVIFPIADNNTVYVKRVLHPDDPITQIIATDMDEGENSQLNYHIVSGDDDSILSIDSTTGLITCSKYYSAPLGHQIKALIHITDSGRPQLSNSTYLLIDFSLEAEPLVEEQTSTKNANIVIIIAVLSGVLMVVLATAIFCLLRQRRRSKAKQTKVQTISQDVPTVYTAAAGTRGLEQYGAVNRGLTPDFDEVSFQQADSKQNSDRMSPVPQRPSVGDTQDENNDRRVQKAGIGECGSEGSDSGHGSNEESSSLPGTLRRWDNRMLTAAVTRQESNRLHSSQSFRSDSTAPPELPPRKRRTSQSFQFRFPQEPYLAPPTEYGSSVIGGVIVNDDTLSPADPYRADYTPSCLEGLDYMYDHPKYHPYEQPPPPYSSGDHIHYPPPSSSSQSIPPHSPHTQPPPPVFQFSEGEGGLHKEEFVDFINIPGYNPYSDDLEDQHPHNYNEQRIYSPDEVFHKDDLLLFSGGGAPAAESTMLNGEEVKPNNMKYCSQV